jgi:hypothetical protein
MFNVAAGQHYTRFFEGLHRSCIFDWYMEVGCRSGRTFGPVRSRTIAVDPYFRTEGNIIGAKPALHVFQQTSDDFFASGFLRAMNVQLSFSFLDGMHLFEFLLRDFMNAEAHSHEKGVIALHDCCPSNLGMTTRDLDNLPKGAWTGDVWKLIPILQEYRPDLKITVLDCRSTGLVLISNLSPGNPVLRQNYDAILARYVPLTLEAFGMDRFAASFQLTDARAYAQAGYPDFKAIAKPGKAFQAPKPTVP